MAMWGTLPTCKSLTSPNEHSCVFANQGETSWRVVLLVAALLLLALLVLEVVILDREVERGAWQRRRLSLVKIVLVVSASPE